MHEGLNFDGKPITGMGSNVLKMFVFIRAWRRSTHFATLVRTYSSYCDYLSQASMCGISGHSKSGCYPSVSPWTRCLSAGKLFDFGSGTSLTWTRNQEKLLPARKISSTLTNVFRLLFELYDSGASVCGALSDECRISSPGLRLRKGAVCRIRLAGQ